jgi:hypothetical protein
MGIGSGVTDEQHHEGFRKAVERKKEESKEASERTSDSSTGSGLEGDQPDLTSPARPQDEYSARAKSSRHKKVIAVKWNQ